MEYPATGQRCIVTGGAGFIGCALSSRLARMFEKVVVIDNLHPQVHAKAVRPAALDAACELVVADVTLPGTWDSVLSGLEPTVIVHLAAETGTGQSLRESTRHAVVNAVGTTQMLDGLSRHAQTPAAILLTSSRAVYGEGCWARPDGERFYPRQRTRAQLESGQWDFAGASPLPFTVDGTRTIPTSVYGATKLVQEHLLRAWCFAMGTSPLILRLQNVYGPGQSLSNPYTGIVSLFARIAKGGGSIPLYEDGEMTRDFVMIDDVAEAIVAALRKRPEDLICDVGSGDATTIREVAEIVGRRYGAPPAHVSGRYRDGDVRHAACDIEPTCRTLDWQPQVRVGTGLVRLCDWIDQQADVPAA